jgi:hypothetical protein
VWFIAIEKQDAKPTNTVFTIVADPSWHITSTLSIYQVELFRR